MNGTCNGTIFGVPAPLGPWGGAKKSSIIPSQLLSQFQSFKNQTLCVYLQMKGIKHIRREFHLNCLGHAPGVGIGGNVGVGGVIFLKFNQSWCVSYLHDWHMQ